MNAVQEIKQRHDMDILLRAIAPAARKRQKARRRKEKGKERINATLGPAEVSLCAWYEGCGVSHLPPVQTAVECVSNSPW